MKGGYVAKRQRDYAAEYRRQKELAKQRGYSSRRQMKKAERLKDWQVAGFPSHAAYQRARAEQVAKAAKYGRSQASQFPLNASPEQFRRYDRAYSSRFGKRARKGEQSSTHSSFIKDLADYLHELDPEVYPEYDDEPGFWENY